MRRVIGAAAVSSLLVSGLLSAPCAQAGDARAKVTGLEWLPAAVIVDANGNAFMTGREGRAMVVAKLGPAGRVLWLHHWWAPKKAHSSGHDIALAPGGGVYVVGSVGLSGYEGGSAFLRRYGPSGRFMWMRATPHWGTKLHAIAYTSVVASKDLVVVAMNKYGCCSMALDDGWARAFTPAGRLLWTHPFETPQVSGTNDRVNDVAIDGRDRVYLAGQVEMTPRTDGTVWVDLGSLLQRLDPSGRVSWNRFEARGPRDADGFTGVALSGHRVMVTGRVGATKHAAGAATMSRMTRGGAEVWTRSWGRGAGPYVRVVATDAAGNAYAAGWVRKRAFLRVYASDGALVRRWRTSGWHSAAAFGVDVGSSGTWVVGTRWSRYGNDRGTIWHWPT